MPADLSQEVTIAGMIRAARLLTQPWNGNVLPLRTGAATGNGPYIDALVDLICETAGYTGKDQRDMVFRLVTRMYVPPLEGAAGFDQNFDDPDATP